MRTLGLALNLLRCKYETFKAATKGALHQRFMVDEVERRFSVCATSSGFSVHEQRLPGAIGRLTLKQMLRFDNPQERVKEVAMLHLQTRVNGAKEPVGRKKLHRKSSEFVAYAR